MGLYASEWRKKPADVRQAADCSKKDGNVKQQKAHERTRANGVPVPGNLNILHNAFRHSMPEEP
jgi:hypothetical protein